MKVYNSLSKQKEPFKPVKAKEVSMYLCGPTVYDKGHLGHARSAVAFDVIRKYFRYRGYKVTFVSNYTDIDDKMINRAAERHISVKQLADEIIPLYKRDYGALGVDSPNHSPKATEFVPHIKALIEKLLANGSAYSTDDGIYFSVKSFREYGKLSHQKLDELRAGARVAVDEKKHAPEDFALWKKEKPGEPAWDGPSGMRGRPGWHIECSAMSMSLLGQTFDIHGGGQDLTFPHHEDELAQSEAATGKTFVNYWLHNGFIRVNDEKMSKSLGNFFTIEDVLKKYDASVVRFFLLCTHYRMPIDFSDSLLEASKAGLERLRDFTRTLKRLKDTGSGNENVSKSLPKLIDKTQKEFESAMDDDFEISDSLASLFDFVKDVNILISRHELGAIGAEKVLRFLESVDSVFGVLFEKDSSLSDELKKLIEERASARNNKDYKKADELRKLLLKKGIEVEDMKDGTSWKRVL